MSGFVVAMRRHLGRRSGRTLADQWIGILYSCVEARHADLAIAGRDTRRWLAGAKRSSCPASAYV